MINPFKILQIGMNPFSQKNLWLSFLFLISFSVLKAETKVLFGGENQFGVDSSIKTFSFFHEPSFYFYDLNAAPIKISKVNRGKIPYGDRFVGGFYGKRESQGSEGKIQFLKWERRVEPDTIIYTIKIGDKEILEKPTIFRMVWGCLIDPLPFNRLVTITFDLNSPKLKSDEPNKVAMIVREIESQKYYISNTQFEGNGLTSMTTLKWKEISSDLSTIASEEISIKGKSIDYVGILKEISNPDFPKEGELNWGGSFTSLALKLD